MRGNHFWFSVLIGLLLVLTGCGGGSNASVPSIQAPSLLTYSSNPVVYTKGVAITTNSPRSSGGPIMLYGIAPALPSGLSLNATTGQITGIPASIMATSTLVVTASNSAGSTTCALRITVIDAPPLAPSINIFTASPARISAGQTSMLGWITSNATSVSINGLSGTLSLNGNASVQPVATTTYTLTAMGAGGTATAQATVTVLGEPSTTFTLPDGVTLEMVPIPAGTFQMGSTTGDDYHAQPAHSVTVRSFYMAKFETTQAQWKAVVTGSASVSADPSYFTIANNYPDDSTRPVEEVSWDMIKDPDGFLKRLNDATASQRESLVFRLPTEAEWEYACRAGSTTTYFWGEDVGLIWDYAWCFSISNGMTSSVSAHPRGPNGFGLHDMIGNVFEWIEDDSHLLYNVTGTGIPNRPDDGTAWTDNPRGPYRIVRGGDWAVNNLGNYRSASREWYPPGNRGWNSGFRVVLASP